jgi:hypothetical protein
MKEDQATAMDASRSLVRRAVIAALALLTAILGLTASSPAARAQATSMCTVDYSLVNSWPGGFQAGITITNDGPAITSWTLAFTFTMLSRHW